MTKWWGRKPGAPKGSVRATLVMMAVGLGITAAAGAVGPGEKVLPQTVAEFRDDSLFYTRDRGARHNIPKPTAGNIETDIAKMELVYQAYYREFLQAQVAELDGDLEKAEQFYKRSLDAPIHEELSYYANVDLARISLKRGEPRKAFEYLGLYLDLLTDEIAGTDEMSDLIGYRAPEEVRQLMKEDREYLLRVLGDLKQLLHITTPLDEFREDPAFFRRVGESKYRTERVTAETVSEAAERGRSFRAALLGGYLAEQEGDYDSAAACYMRCVDDTTEQDYFFSYRDLARVSLKAGRLKEAEAHLEKYVAELTSRLQPADESGYYIVDRDRLEKDKAFHETVLEQLRRQNADVRGTYQTVSESEWNLTVELKDNGVALIILENWLPGEYELRQYDTSAGQWLLRDDVVLLSYNDVVDTLTFDQNLSRQELGQEGGTPGLEQRTEFDPARSLIRGNKLWRIQTRQK